MILTLVLVSCILVPYQLAFIHSTPAVHNGVMFAISLVFLVDIGLNFITSYRSTGSEVLEPKAIRLNYLRTHFGVDIIANLPFGMLLWLAGDPQWGPFSAVLWVRLLTLLRLNRFFVILRRWESISWTHPGYLRVFKYMGVILVITHCIACLWFALAYVDGFPADSWVIAAGIENANPVSQYIRSLYWTITTMTTVGYGDISPNTALGQAIAAIVMVIGFTIIAVPTGIVVTEMAQARGKPVSTQVCPECATEGHDHDAVFCKDCGSRL